LRIAKWMQAGVREMDMRETIVPIAPRFGRAFDFAQHKGRDRFAVSGGKKC
jgi:hypothetical protein